MNNVARIDGGVLLVGSRRELRRSLFDTLDRAGCRTIRSARDLAHAAVLLAGSPAESSLHMVVLVLEGDEAQARASCEQLRQLPAASTAPLIAVLAEGATCTPANLPPAVTDWLHADQIGTELAARWHRVLESTTQTPPAPAAMAQSPAVPAGVEPAPRPAEAALSVLERFFSADSGRDASAAARLLFDELALDYLAVWSARPQAGAAPVQILQLCRREPNPWSPARLQGVLQQALGGDAVGCTNDANELVSTAPLAEPLDLAGFIGLPLLDERRTVLGALLAGRSRGLAEGGVIEPVLRCAATSFARRLELEHAREQAGAGVLVDALTGLPSRLLLSDRLETILREATRNGECFAVLLIDLDRFKSVNDSYGHAAGDHVLQTISRRLLDSIRASDTLVRHDGDAFVVVLRHIVKNDDVLRVADKMRKVIERTIVDRDGVRLKVTVSMGLCFFPDDAGDVESLLRHADEALAAAKELGRNGLQIYEASPEDVREHGMALRSRLRHAQGNGELRVVYQPQVDGLSEDIVGMEALVRWEHPELGLISPAVFIPLAEETGLIVSLGEWVLHTACRQAREWEDRYGLRLRLGVNLSAVQLMEPHLLDMVTRALRETGLDPALLEVEITESISIKTSPELLENLEALHRLGSHIAIDDFGTGAASLDYLRRLPADRIKIDQSFVRNIGVDPDDEAIVRTTIEMAHRLHRTVVAEGAETEQHLEFLRSHHCDVLQGYLFCRPLAPVSFDRLLAERRRLLEARLVESA